MLRSLCRPRSKAARAAALAAMFFLVLLDRDDRLDAAAGQPGAVGSGGVSLVGQREAGCGAVPSPPTDADGLHERDESRAVAVLGGTEDPGDRPAAPAGGEVNLRGQVAAGQSALALGDVRPWFGRAAES